jgi:hypothetical protein
MDEISDFIYGTIFIFYLPMLLASMLHNVYARSTNEYAAERGMRIGRTKRVLG